MNNEDILAVRNPELEICELKRKLWEMSALCQQLQEKFDFLENKMRSSEAQNQTAPIGEKSEGASANDFASLKEKLRELVAMNMNWQRFNSQQEKVIQDQNTTIKRLERELAVAKSCSGERAEAGQLPESQQIEFDRLFLAKKHECNSLEEEKNKIEDENHQLRQKLITLEKNFGDTKERCDLLETQLVMFQEDFKTERSDRERAQSKISELEIQVAELRALQGSRPSQFDPCDLYGNGYNRVGDGGGETLRGRGVYQATGDNGNALSTSLAMRFESRIGSSGKTVVVPTTSVYQTDGVDETDSYRIVDLTEGAASSAPISLSDMLSCPKCSKTFTRDRHLDLVEHMEECR